MKLNVRKRMKINYGRSLFSIYIYERKRVQLKEKDQMKERLSFKWRIGSMDTYE